MRLTKLKVSKNIRPRCAKFIDDALELTTRNLDYTYGSADPANGGMDCSGFIFYVLTQNGVQDVPRDSSQQYVWLRKAGNFRAVNSRHEDTFELDELVPGDLLFWTGTYSIERDPPITHAMIYLGREKGTNQRIMVGASDGRTYKGESRYGVSVFDFKIRDSGKTDDGRMSPSFIGYGHIPGLGDRRRSSLPAIVGRFRTGVIGELRFHARRSDPLVVMRGERLSLADAAIMRRPPRASITTRTIATQRRAAPPR